jgi:hypothetical protein
MSERIEQLCGALALAAGTASGAIVANFALSGISNFQKR